MLKIKVKVSKVTNLSEARYCAGMGVDFLSFPVSQVDPKTFAEITGWVAGPKFGVEINSDDYDQYKADFVDTNCESLDTLQQDQLAFVHLSVNEWFENKVNLIRAKDRIIGVELSIHSIDDAKLLIEEISKEFDVYLKPATSIDLESMLELHIAGISLEGNPETKPGLKEYPLAEILEKLESD